MYCASLRRHKRNVPRVVGLALVLLVVVQSVVGSDESADADDPYASDFRSFAQQNEVTEAQARQLEELTPAVRALSDEAERQYPSTFGGAYRNIADGGRIKLALTRDAVVATERLTRRFR